MPKIDVVQSLPCWTDDITTPYGIATLFFCGRIVRDRFNILNKYSKFAFIDLVDDIPKSDTTPLADLMDRRAQELINMGSITAQWSGGVDSTALLLALIRNGIKKDQLTVFYDVNSVDEYPKLFMWLKENNYNLVSQINWRKALSTTSTDIITNGWCADQLFGSVFFHNAPEMYLKTMEDMLLETRTPLGLLTKDNVMNAVKVYKKMAKDLFDINLVTAAELGWFINFTVKWSWVSTYNELYLASTPNQFKTHVFYNTPYFQSWALNNFNNVSKVNIYGDNAAEYKKPLKEYCNSVFEDLDFLQNKTKKPSWNATQNNSMFRKKIIVFKTDEGYSIYNLPTKLPYRKLPDFSTKVFTDIFAKYYKKANN